MSGLLPIEEHLRTGETLDQDAQLVVRGWPLSVDGLLRNADATRRRYARLGQPFVAVSAEVTVLGWDVDAILSGPRLRLRRTYAAALLRSLIEADFDLIATFAPPHYSVVLPAYDVEIAQRLLEVLGEVRHNPHHLRRSSD